MKPAAASDTALVFVPGFACSASDWDGVIARTHGWAERIVLSLPGHDGVPADEGVCTIEALADLVNARRESLASPHHILVGHSMGARIVLEAAVRDPRRVRGVSAIDNSLQARGPVDAAIAALRALSDDERSARVVALFAGMFCGRPIGSFRQSAMDRLRRMDPATLARLSEAILRWDAERAGDRLCRVTSPLLILQSTTAEDGGTRRSIVPDEDTHWTRLVREEAGDCATIITLPALGHFPQVEAPDLIAQALADFWPTLALPSAC